MYNVVDPADSRWVFNDHEFGGLMRIDQRLGTMTDIQPRRPQAQEPYRFNWTPPLHLSPHNGAILYAGAQVLLRSLDRGDHWQEISPDLTTNDRAKLAITGGSISFCTITTISESPLQPGLIWVGTDDGKVQVTRNGGSSWQDLSRGLAAAGAPAPFWVSRVFASPHATGTAYAAKTGFRNDDDRSLLFKTTDFGQTWTPISAGLPQRCVNAVIEDARKPGLLFAGTDGGVYLSPDGGLHWLYLKGNMPRVKVTDLLIHPRESDLVVATYGRGLFIGDMSVLRELDENVLAQAAFLFSIKPKTQRVTAGWGNYGLLGDRHLSTPNESEAVVIPYYLKEKGEATVTIADLSGRLLRKLTAKGNAGLNVLFWDMRLQKEGPEYLWPLVEPGEYGVTLEAAGKKLTRQALIKGRTGWSLGPHPLVIK